MGTRKNNKPGSHVAADSISSDSLSFAGFVSIQDHHHHQDNKQHYSESDQTAKHDPDFEFSTVTTGSSSSNSFVASPFRITPAEMLISNGQLIKPHAIAFQPHRSKIFTNTPLSLRSLLEIEVEHFSNYKMARGETSNSPRKYNEQLVKARNLKNTSSKMWFGHKMFRSFVSPCRKCEAVQPEAAKGQAVQRERYKMH